MKTNYTADHIKDNILKEACKSCEGETTDLWRRLHPPRCTTAHDCRWIVLITVMDRTAKSQTIAQQIQSVKYHSMSARTIRRRLQQSGMSVKRRLLRLPLTANLPR
ncbi:hypothetical protein TNCV_1658981 [Trichonephila clavipes]|nr:hypothetical protein TNCV_1658981 [Trichonephila clavipes]